MMGSVSQWFDPRQDRALYPGPDEWLAAFSIEGDVASAGRLDVPMLSWASRQACSAVRAPSHHSTTLIHRAFAGVKFSLLVPLSRGTFNRSLWESPGLMAEPK